MGSSHAGRRTLRPRPGVDSRLSDLAGRHHVLRDRFDPDLRDPGGHLPAQPDHGHVTSFGMFAFGKMQLVGNCAEWILELPLSNSIVQLPQYGSVFFENESGAATRSGSTLPLGQGDLIQMSNNDNFRNLDRRTFGRHGNQDRLPAPAPTRKTGPIVQFWQLSKGRCFRIRPTKSGSPLVAEPWVDVLGEPWTEDWTAQPQVWWCRGSV